MGKLIKGGVYSKPVKLQEYPATKGPTQVKPATVDANQGYSEKLPRK